MTTGRTVSGAVFSGYVMNTRATRPFNWAKRTVEDFRRRFAEKVLDHHDIGFLYSLSSKAEWIIEKNESARQLTLEVAELPLETLASRRWIYSSLGS